MAIINLDITLQENIGVSLEPQDTIKIDFGQDSAVGSEITPIQNDIGIALGDGSPVDIDFGLNGVYTGEYEMTSKVNEQVLSTANKRMMNDIIIKPISVQKAKSPNNDGYVVTIG